MDCERKGCGHPLAVHDPCSADRCKCRSFVPVARKKRVALLTDVTDAEVARILKETRRG